ncbi:YihY/virulence factor BrkB family protein [Acetobacteraceae bacterium H6797]|nr:YihY/virulence factor BrkB family protein [Acetobacteraceae bacterium H6797]
MTSIARFGRIAWFLLRHTVIGLMSHDAFSRAAAISFYTVGSLAPLLSIAIAISGVAFGQEAARDAILDQLGGVLGPDGRALLAGAMRSAADPFNGRIAALIGGIGLLITASGVFAEIQGGLNRIWGEAPKLNIWRMLGVRALGLALVATLGLLMSISLLISAALAALSQRLNEQIPGTALLASLLNLGLSLVLLSALFAAIYKLLPDNGPKRWRYVFSGAALTALLLTLGKSLIATHIGSSGASSAYGPASALMALLLWTYYAAAIVLAGAEFTRSVEQLHERGRRLKEASEETPDRMQAADQAAMLNRTNG